MEIKLYAVSTVKENSIQGMITHDSKIPILIQLISVDRVLKNDNLFGCALYCLLTAHVMDQGYENGTQNQYCAVSGRLFISIAKLSFYWLPENVQC